MSVYRMGLVWQYSTASGTALLVLLALADYADDDGVAFPAVASIARKARIGERQAQTILRRFEALGEIDIYEQAMPFRTAGGVQRTNIYVVRTGEGAKATAPPSVEGAQSNVRGGEMATAPEPLEEPSKRTSSIDTALVLRSELMAKTKITKNGSRPVADVVDAFRALGVRASAKDGPVIAGLVGRYGADSVRRVIEADGPSIVAADSPLLFLAAQFRRSRGRAGPRETMNERAERYAVSLGKLERGEV